MAKNDLQGTLELLVLKTLERRGPLHGYGIALHVQEASKELLQIEEGSLYPALHRMEQQGWLRSEWQTTSTGRRARYYSLKAAGRREVERAEREFERLVEGVRAVLGFA
jgi:transcriptional regulator